jgi:hypothetical protein
VALHPAAPNVPLKVPRDFLPIGFVAENPMFIATSPSLLCVRIARIVL